MSSIWQIGALFAAVCGLSSAARVPNPTVEFVFDRTECLAGYARDRNDLELFGRLSIDNSKVDCKGVGVEAKRGSDGPGVISEMNSSLFSHEMDKGRGWTLETWMILGNFSDCPSCTFRGLASITTKAEEENKCSKTSGLAVLQRHPEMTLLMRQGEGDDSCHDSSTSSAIDLGLPVHVVYTSERSDFAAPFDIYRTTRWYINGITAGVDHIEHVPWSAQQDSYLQMLTTPGSRFDGDYASAGGSVLFFALYNQTLDDDEVLQNFEAGLGNIAPVAEDMKVVIDEDGATKQDYPVVAPEDLPKIVLSVKDMDQEVGFPGFDGAREPVPPEVFIDSLPNRGMLYDLDGTAIIAVPHKVLYATNYSVRYRPDKDGFSGLNRTFTSFTYSAVDGVTGHSSAVSGRVDIYVLPRNDPPLPVNMSTIVLAGEANTITLDGVDVDSLDGDFIAGAVVQDLPTHGVLYQVNGNKTRVEPGERVNGRSFVYVYNGSTSQVNDTSYGEFSVKDHLTYRVFDSSGALSTLGHVSLRVVSGMRAVSSQSQNDTSWMCREDTENVVNVYVENAGSIGGNVVVVLAEVPKHGSLLQISDGSYLGAGDAVATNCSSFHLCMASMTYVPMKDFFTSPDENWIGDAVNGVPQREAFTFYAVRDSGEYSNLGIQSIQVSNSNDGTGILCPAGVQVQPLGTSSYSDSTWSPLDRVTIDGFALIDPDKGLDLVKVKVHTTFGLLTLNSDYVGAVQFNTALCYEGGGLQCRGSGWSDRDMVFLADPATAEEALNGIMYQSMNSDVEDSILITVLDGVGEECLGADVNPGSIQQTCWKRSCAVNVTVMGRDVRRRRVLIDVSVIVYVGILVFFSLLLYIQCAWLRREPPNRV